MFKKIWPAMVAALFLAGGSVSAQTFCEPGTQAGCPNGEWCLDQQTGCVECLIDDHCTDPAAPVCGNNNTCRQCNNDSECDGAEPYCSSGECVECTDDSECGGAEPYCRGEECVECAVGVEEEACGDLACVNDTCVTCTQTGATSTCAQGAPCFDDKCVRGCLTEEHWGSSRPDARGCRFYDVCIIANDGDKVAMSAGYFTTNDGTHHLNWRGSDSCHPAMVYSLYKEADGKLRQLGQSWVKHAFYAVNAPDTECTAGLCQLGIDDPDCPDPEPPSGRILGVQNDDLYSAQVQSGTFRLGPKADVDPYTGEVGQPSGATPGDDFNRGLLVVDRDELHDTSATYYLEYQVVTPDDAPADGFGGNNNSMYAHVGSDILLNHPVCSSDPTCCDEHPCPAGAVPCCGPTMVAHGPWPCGPCPSLAPCDNSPYIDSTSMQEPAIYAWNGATVVEVDTGSGVFLVGYRSQSIAGGRHRYDYAVLNRDSATGATQLRIPAGSKPGITSVDFSDVDYHSGDQLLVDQTDWTGTVTGQGVKWTAPTPPQNFGVNSIRWSTMYNFGFESAKEPGSGTATLFLEDGTQISVPGVDGPGL